MSETEQTEQTNNTINYNPVFPVLTANIKLALPVDDMVQDILQIATDIKNYEGGYTSYYNQQSLDHVRGVKELKEAIYGVACSFGRELKYEMDYEKCSIQLWANVMRKGGYHSMHNHAHSVFSGTFYAKVDDTTSPFILMNPTTPFRNHDPMVRTQDRNAFTADVLTITPEVNTMNMWPSWMYHSVPEMQVGGPRISLSFNVDFLPTGA